MTLLPNKHVPTNRSLVGLGAKVLGRLGTPTTVSELWEQIRNDPEIGSFHRFILALDYLYAIEAINYERGLLSESQR